MTPAAVVGWAPGSTDLNRDTSPLWVTAVNPAPGTLIYVDRDGDPATGALGPDPNGNRYDVTCAAVNLQSLRVFDDGGGVPNPPPSGSCFVPPAGSGDNNQTGMRIYTVNGTKLAAAWGQDVALASSGQPTELDMGTTVLPFSSLNAFKDGALLVDLNGNGGVDIGDTILYTTVVRNTGITPVTEIFVTDTLDSGTAYVAGTFEVDGLPVADDAFPSQQAQPNAYPLDTDAPHTGGFVLVESPAGSPAPIYATPLIPGGRITLTYQVVVLRRRERPDRQHGAGALGHRDLRRHLDESDSDGFAQGHQDLERTGRRDSGAGHSLHRSGHQHLDDRRRHRRTADRRPAGGHHLRASEHLGDRPASALRRRPVRHRGTELRQQQRAESLGQQ